MQVQGFIVPKSPLKVSISKYPSVSRSKVGGQTLTTTYKMPNLIETAVSGYNAMPSAAKTEIKENVKNVARDVGNKVKDTVRSRGNGNNRYNPGDPYVGDHARSGYGLTSKPNPAPISLSTGVDPKAQVSDYLDAELNKCSPMHVTGARFSFPSYASSRLYNYFINDIAFHVQVNAQRNISYYLDLTNFSAANILTAMNDLCFAIQTLFYYKSIINYYDKYSNNNGGMSAIRHAITPQMISDLYLLERRLKDTPVPPNLLKVLRYLSGNFAASNNPGCAILKIVPLVTSDTMVNGADITGALSNLSAGSNNLIFTQLRRAVPHWVPGEFYDVPQDIVYDDQFLTIFANLPFFNFIGNNTTLYTPKGDTNDSVIQYNSFSNMLDGLSFCMTSVWTLDANQFAPGFMSPTNPFVASDLADSRRSYYTDGTTAKFYGSDNIEFLARSRRETYTLNRAMDGYIAPHLAGASNVIGVTANRIQEIGLKAVDYLMSIDNIKVDARNYHFPKQGRGK